MKEIYVNDNLEAAISEANNYNGEVVIILGEGRFEISKPIEITKNNLTIKGQGEKTVISGSKKILLEKKEGIICIDLKKYGITEYGILSGGPYEDFWNDYEIPKPYMQEYGHGLEIFYKDIPLPVVRYPKKGFMKIKKATGSTAAKDPLGNPHGFKEGSFIPEDEKVKAWINEKELLLIGYWLHDWAMQRHTIETVDEKTGEIKVSKPYHLYGYRDGAEFCAINVLSELNTEGEWYLNRKEGKLYIIPYKNQEEIYVSVSDGLFIINDKKNIKISDVSIEQCRTTAVIINNSNNISVDNCTIKNLGAWALIAENSSEISVTNCHVYNTGGGGISLTGGDRNTLTSSNNTVSNNIIHDVARWHRVYLPAVQICGTGGRISGNKIYDVPHFGIVFHGNNHIIEKNEIYNACYEANDAGAIYSGKDWTCRGNIFRHNYLHDLKGRNNNGCIGLYFDDALSSADIYENIFANIKRGILVGGGRDFNIKNNIFYNCETDISIDDRLNNWGENSIPKLKKRLSEVDYKNRIWAKAYPELSAIMEQKYWLPENNSLENNINIML